MSLHKATVMIQTMAKKIEPLNCGPISPALYRYPAPTANSRLS